MSRNVLDVGDARWLDPLEQQTWRRLGAVLNLLPGALEAQLQRDSDLTHYEYWVLAMLSEAPGNQLRMSQLAAWTNASPSRLSHVVSRLEEGGWVTRQRVPNDGRGYAATLTPEGVEMVVRSAPGHVEAVRQNVFDGLTQDQISAFDEILGVLLERLDPDGEFGSPTTR
jgi:DNA-binding MarR family transcriptional regulator